MLKGIRLSLKCSINSNVTKEGFFKIGRTKDNPCGRLGVKGRNPRPSFWYLTASNSLTTDTPTPVQTSSQAAVNWRTSICEFIWTWASAVSFPRDIWPARYRNSGTHAADNLRYIRRLNVVKLLKTLQLQLSLNKKNSNRVKRFFKVLQASQLSFAENHHLRPLALNMLLARSG